MSKLSISKEMVSKNKHKAISCSTPERQADSPSRDSDSLCDSDTASPVPFLCTQDGAEGETDVVWNFYTPTSKNTHKTRYDNSTPLSRKSKRSLRQKMIEKPAPRRKGITTLQKNTVLFQELLELKQNLQTLIPKEKKRIENEKNSGSDDDIFSDSQDCSPKTNRRSSSHCLRKNLLSSNYNKPEMDNAMDSDDSMNECLLKASQVVEEVILKKHIFPENKVSNDSIKRINIRDINADVKFKMDHDSMDAILNSICLDPSVVKKNNCESPRLGDSKLIFDDFVDDSFDNFVGNLNDSELDRLTQLPRNPENVYSRNTSKGSKDWSVKELVVHESPSKSTFGRHNSMPESPSLDNMKNQPSTSGMSFGRYNSMPHKNDIPKTVPDLSPMRCTPDEIKKKHQLAKEKLMAKRLLPFTSQSTQAIFQPTQKQPINQPTQKQPIHQSTKSQTKTTQFKLKIPSQNRDKGNTHDAPVVGKLDSETVDIKSIIEKKRKEALLRLRKRQPQSKIM